MVSLYSSTLCLFACKFSVRSFSHFSCVRHRVVFNLFICVYFICIFWVCILYFFSPFYLCIFVGLIFFPSFATKSLSYVIQENFEVRDIIKDGGKG